MKIGVIGLGLMGASIAGAIQKFRSGEEIWGLDYKDVVKKAEDLGIIHHSCFQIQDFPQDLDILFLAAPISANREYLQKITERKDWQDLLITDLSSTKSGIIRAADSLEKGNWSFIGGHPMVGSEKQGIGAYNPFLYENAVYVLSETKKHFPSSEKFNQLIKLLYDIGARIIKLPPDLHDRLAAYVSHLPHVIASTLINYILGLDKEDLFFQLAAGGYRNLTRIADGDVGLWNDILTDNKEFLSEAVDSFIKALSDIRDQIVDGDAKEALLTAKKKRNTLSSDTRGFVNPLIDLRLEIEDKPGVLSDITYILFSEAINIKDISILKIRENLGGVLQLSFDSQKNKEKAAILLSSKGYRIC